MLHKRFKSAKCKTALKLATSRIKLMKNKKGVQINQMKRELAQLLETGQDRTARIRVEHVIREEKMVAAYDLIEIYCELIVARLPIIESQKTCPLDLKEAVTSVIFAAPRCSDISELYDVRKQFTAKYGKDFVSAAIELHPDCGVSRMLVEKLSAVAPDLQTKIKVLSDVAKDHNIDWDPTSFEEKESKPSSDLLNGPANFENASMANVEPSKVQPVYSHEEKQSTPVDFSEQNRKYTLNTQNVTSPDSAGETSSSGVTHDWMETKQNWNMEFKDATSAAQAAAESAERAAAAARAAAQFSSQEKIANRPPTGPHVFNSRDEYSHVSTSSGYSGESFLDDGKPNRSNQEIDQSQHGTSLKATERFNRSNNDSAGPHVSTSRYKPSHVSAPSGYSGESSSDDRKPKTLNQDIYQSQHGTSQKATETFDRSNNDSIEDETLVNNFHMTDGYYENSLHEDQEGFSSPERESKTELVSDRKESTENENINFFATEKQPTIHSSHSHFSSYGDEPDVRKKAVVGNPFAVVDQESPFKESVKTSSNDDDDDDDDVISDDNDDDDVGGGPRFDTGFQYDEMEANIWSPKMNTIGKPNSQSHIFSESVSFGDQSVKSIEPSETDNFAPASFDHSDGPDSGSENELLSMNPKSSSVIESSQTFNSRKTRIELNDLVEEGTSFEDEEKQMRSQHELKKRNLDQESSDSSDDNDNGDSINQRLNFGTLTGGLRNKGGLKYPPYTKSATIEKPTAGSQAFYQSSFDSRARWIEDKTLKVPISITDSDSDSDLKANKKVNTRPIFSPPAAFFNDDGMDSEDEAPKQVTNKVRLGPGISRRTRGSPSVPYSKTNVETGQIKSTTFEPQVNRFAHTKQEAVKIVPEYKIPMGERISSRIVVESGNLKDVKTQNVGSEMTSEVKKVSHVHPKLPEYDSLAARLQSLRTDRQ